MPFTAPVTVSSSPPVPTVAVVIDTPDEDDVDVILEAVGDQKIQVIKEVRSLTSLGYKEAKELVDAAPKAVLEKVSKEVAAKARETLEGAGAVTSIQDS